MSINNEKLILEDYGEVIEFNNLKTSEVTEQVFNFPPGNRIHPMFLIRESKIKIFRNYVINTKGIIQIPVLEHLYSYVTHLINKKNNYLEISLHIEGSHFVPDKIHKDDILFFYQIDNKFFIIIKDEYLHQSLNSEYSIFGMIDFSKGTNLLFNKDNHINQKMKIFHRKIDALASKYQNVLFITISDSILLKYSFKLIGEEKIFQPDKLHFDRIIEIFKEIRKIVQQIFQMNIYGVFTYGKNKCATSQVYLKNAFHTGILSSEFKKMIDMETEVRKWIRKQGNTKKGDMYLSPFLYRAYRFYRRKKHQYSHEIIELSTKEWGLRSDKDNDIVAMKIPDKPLIIKKPSYSS